VLDPAPEPPSFQPSPPDESEPSPAPRPTLPVERLGALIEVFLCSGFPTQLLVLGALTEAGLPARGDDGSLSPAFVTIWALSDMVLVLGLVYTFLRAHGEPVREFVVGARRPSREVALGVLLIPAAFALVVLVLAIVLVVRPSLNNVPVNPFERMMQTPTDAAVFALVVMLAGGVREEVQRGFIVRRFDQYLGGGLVGVAVYTVVFGLGHIEQGYAAAIATGGLGVLWGWVYYVRRSIIAPMVSHAGFNLGQLVKYVSLG
jgi:membrane protease YdiL (CAAX protease family)